MRPEILDMLRDGVGRLGSQAAAARALGVSAASISLLLTGRYQADTAQMERRIEQTWGVVACPHLDQEISAAECGRYRGRRCPTSSAADLQHWRACRSCAAGARLGTAQEGGPNGR